jgi:glucose uptake protein GlcU
MQRKYILLTVFCTWLLGVLIYGCVDICRTMEELRVNPSSDLYANSVGFQIIAFAVTKGMASLLLLGLGLIAGLSWRIGDKPAG